MSSRSIRNVPEPPPVVVKAKVGPVDQRTVISRELPLSTSSSMPEKLSAAAVGEVSAPVSETGTHGPSVQPESPMRCAEGWTA